MAQPGGGWILAVFVALPLVAFFVGSVLWLLRGARAATRPGMVGDALHKPIALAPGESILETMYAVRKHRWFNIRGALYFTHERFMFLPIRDPMNDTGEPFSVLYRDVQGWFSERRRRLRPGSLPSSWNAIVVRLPDANEEVFWPVPGYDLAAAFARHVPPSK